MAEIQKINAESAAHNIAKIFSQKYIESLKNSNIFSVEHPDMYDTTKKAALLYANVYDEAYEYFSTENKKD